MRGFKPSLTARGWTLLAGGIAFGVIAAMLGEPDLVWVAIFVALLPLLGLLVVTLMRPRFTVQRTAEPPQVPIGGRPRAAIMLDSANPASFTAVDFRDRTPAELGADARFSLAHGPGSWKQPVGYTIRADHRGHFTIGPLRATATDPLGVARIGWQVPDSVGSLRVTPRVWPLGSLKASVSSGSTDDATPQRIGQAGSDDVLVREHRPGDDIRRIHWRTSARLDELMVRLEEHPWDPAALVVLDNRADAHPGSGPEGSFEWSVSLAASIATQLLGGRHRVTVLSASGEVFGSGHGDGLAGSERLLRVLTDVQTSGEQELGRGIAAADVMAGSQTVVGALGLLTAADAAALSAVGSRAVSCVAVVPDPAAWGVGVGAERRHRDACRLLVASGWTIHEHRPGESVPEAWASLGARQEARR